MTSIQDVYRLLMPGLAHFLWILSEIGWNHLEHLILIAIVCLWRSMEDQNVRKIQHFAPVFQSLNRQYNFNFYSPTCNLANIGFARRNYLGPVLSHISLPQGVPAIWHQI